MLYEHVTKILPRYYELIVENRFPIVLTSPSKNAREVVNPPPSGAIQHGARSQNMTYFRLQFLIGPSITMLYPVLVYISGSALAKSISNWHLIGHNEGCCSNTGYILLPCLYGIRLWIWPEPLVAPCVRRALGTRMAYYQTGTFSYPEPFLRATRGSGQIHNRIP